MQRLNPDCGTLPFLDVREQENLAHIWAHLWIGPDNDQICFNRRCEIGFKFPFDATVPALTHETLHLVINSLEGIESGRSLDNIELWETMKDWVDPPEQIRWTVMAREINAGRVKDAWAKT